MENQLNIAPLSGGYALTCIIGFLISAFYVLPLNKKWGFALLLIFSLMFVASMISMTYAPSDWPLRMDIKKK